MESSCLALDNNRGESPLVPWPAISEVLTEDLHELRDTAERMGQDLYDKLDKLYELEDSLCRWQRKCNFWKDLAARRLTEVTTWRQASLQHQQASEVSM